MILDLGALKQETLDITMPNGLVLNVKKPSKGLLIEIYKFDLELARQKDVEKLANAIEEITAKILSNNKSKHQIKAIELEDLDIDYTLQFEIFKAYMSFVSKANKNPN